ncbi:TrmB family transcriptional regulator [Halomarina rubra]|uniref:TrmB family transcriptional regulator sugar-binding domain-containing protein n=1 Tax=Halomarina rubra TaxID=2071873 RepID=A0ABD6AUZ2_9EURY|nr:TrmB family transcriptional regulator [Halomarina rubra]
MDTEELIETFEAAGLSPYQAHAYVALLDLGAASATELAEASGVPKPRIYDVLDALEGHGFVETYENDALCAQAHSPDEVLAALRDRAGRLEAAATEVEERWEEPDLENNRASIVKQFTTVLNRAEEFVQGATHQIQLSATPDDFERLRPALRDAHERGVSTRVSIHTLPDEEPPSVDRFEGVCIEARHRPLPAPFVVLVDRQQTCFAHHPGSFEQYGVLVDDRTHTYVFHWYFMTCLWEHWETVYSLPTDEPPVEYVDIRYCVSDLNALLADDATVTVRVEGYDLETGEEVVFTGRVADTHYAPGPPDGDATRILQLAGQVTVVVETDRGEVSVGGWGAVVEDVEATRITVESVTYPDRPDRRSER